MKWKVNFFDKYSDETRTLTVEAKTEEEAEEVAEKEADQRGWPLHFRILDAEELYV